MVLAQRRLRTQHLVGPGLATPLDVVRWLGAVQAQDPVGAAWGIAQRTRSGALARLAGQRAPGVLEGHLIIVDGLLVGGWGQRIARGDVAVTSRLLIEPTAAEARALAAAITRYRAAIRSSAAA